MLAPPVAEKKNKKKTGTGRRGPAPTPTDLGRAFRFPPDVKRDDANATLKVYPEVAELLNKLKSFYGFTVADVMLVFWDAMQAQHRWCLEHDLALLGEKKPTE